MWGILSCHVARGGEEGGSFSEMVSRLLAFARSGVCSSAEPRTSFAVGLTWALSISVG